MPGRQKSGAETPMARIGTDSSERAEGGATIKASEREIRMARRATRAMFMVVIPSSESSSRAVQRQRAGDQVAPHHRRTTPKTRHYAERHMVGAGVRRRRF